MVEPNRTCDVLLIGGGPAGATAAILLARAGVSVILLEKAQFPRFHIGESLLPRTFRLIQELGLEPELRKIPHVPKFGAEFITADGLHNVRFDFADGFSPADEAFNIERAPFDAMLLKQAEIAGCDVRHSCGVKKIIRLSDGDVRVLSDSGEIQGRYLIDASGQGTVIGRHLGLRKNAEEAYLRKAAYFSHFEGADRAPGRGGGHPLIVMLEEGWFWIIPLDEQRTSVGLVMDAEMAQRVRRDAGIGADEMLQWGIARCPAVRERMRQAKAVGHDYAAADFSYHCRPYAGPGYFLVGDAAAFMDPIFSTGVCLAMTGGAGAARRLIEVLAGRTSPAAAQRAHIRLLERSTRTLFRMIRQYYDHSFRELFLNGTGPFQMHRAVVGVLGGNVFPTPWRLRWRMALFNLSVRLNRLVPLVPRRKRFSLLSAAAEAEQAPEAAVPVGK